MRSCSVRSLALCAIISTTSFFSASGESRQSNVPNLIIKTIYNNTPHDILLVDRLGKNHWWYIGKKSSIILPAGKTTEVNFTTNGQNNVIIQGSMSECMAQDAQYVFKKLDQDGNPEPDQEVYFNLHTTGVNESFALNHYVAGKNGGCQMIGGKFNAGGSKIAEVTLELSKKDATPYPFKMNIDRKIIFQ